jgi:hypothetical protein
MTISDIWREARMVKCIAMENYEDYKLRMMLLRMPPILARK